VSGARLPLRHALLAHAMATAGPAEWAVVAWRAAGNTLFGYSAWGWLRPRRWR
jgi:O-acetylserine/cysteine efflux transporter